MSTTTNPALDRVNKTSEAVYQAQLADAAARAEYARLELLALADATPGVVAFSFDVTSEYDDEGGYFPVVNIYAEFADSEAETSEAAYNLQDDMIEVENMLTDMAITQCYGERKTVQELREVNW